MHEINCETTSSSKNYTVYLNKNIFIIYIYTVYCHSLTFEQIFFYILTPFNQNFDFTAAWKIVHSDRSTNITIINLTYFIFFYLKWTQQE